MIKQMKRIKGAELPYLVSDRVGYVPVCNEILWREILGDKLICNRCGVLCTHPK